MKEVQVSRSEMSMGDLNASSQLRSHCCFRGIFLTRKICAPEVCAASVHVYIYTAVATFGNEMRHRCHLELAALATARLSKALPNVSEPFVSNKLHENPFQSANNLFSQDLLFAERLSHGLCECFLPMPRFSLTPSSRWPQWWRKVALWFAFFFSSRPGSSTPDQTPPFIARYPSLSFRECLLVIVYHLDCSVVCT